MTARKGLSLKALSLSNSTLPERPGYGTSGRQITLMTNYFHLLPDPKKMLYKYAVEIDSEVKGARKKRRILALLLQTDTLKAVGHGIATDYSSTVITSKELDLGDDGRQEIKLHYYDKEDVLPGQQFQPSDRTKQYTIKIQSTGNVAIPELLEYLDSTKQSSGWDAKSETIQALNIVMARTPNSNENVVASSGNKFYPYPSFPERRDNYGNLQLENSLGGGLVALRGYYSSVRTSTLRVLVNVNVCTSAFYPAIRLLDLFQLRLGRLKDLKPGDWAWLEPFIKKLRVTTNYIKRNGATVTQVKTIRGFSRPPRSAPQIWYANANQMKFRAEGVAGVDPKKDISVTEYFNKSGTPKSINCGSSS